MMMIVDCFNSHQYTKTLTGHGVLTAQHVITVNPDDLTGLGLKAFHVRVMVEVATGLPVN